MINDNLSWAARGLLTYLVSKPEDWEVSTASLVNQTKLTAKKTGRDGVYVIINELIGAGYMVRGEQARGDNGKMGSYEYTVYDSPQPDLPDTAAPDTANTTQVSNELNKEMKVKQISNSCSASPNEKKSKFKFNDEQMSFAKHMQNCLKELNPNQKEPNFEAWANDIRLLNEVDNRSGEEINRIWAWANNDDFWRKVILSPSKLRSKFDDLTIQANDVPKVSRETNSTDWVLKALNNEI
jgi:hypothetical protein